MARSVVRLGTPRCEHCRQPHRWCICAGLRTLECPLAVDVVQHAEEVHKPTSTGSLIVRTLQGARRHVYDHRVPLVREVVQREGHEMWIIHPAGEPLPPRESLTLPVQAVLLDANWSQARFLMRDCENWGRRVSLPMVGESRYWLRAQNGEGRFSTLEALLFLLEHLKMDTVATELRVQFELHVYAGLRTRGRVKDAERYRETSPIRERFPDLMAALG